MMKGSRIAVASLVLASILMLVAASLMYVCQSCDRLLARTNSLLTALDDNIDDTYGNSSDRLQHELESLTELWQQEQTVMQIFVPRQETEEISRTTARLLPMYQESCDEFRAELSALRDVVLRVKEMQLFVL